MYNAVETTLKKLLDAAGLPHSGVVRNDVAGQVVFAIQAEDARALIGTHGDTVHAIDHLVKKIIETKTAAGSPVSGVSDQAAGGPDSGGEKGLYFLVDVNDYRAKQIKDLQAKALMMAERARSLEYDVELTPMTAYERLIIHTTLQGEPHVKTESQGEGRNRRVVIRYVESVGSSEA